MIILGTETRTKDSFKLISNIIYYSSTKYKRVIRSILVLEIYGIVLGVDLAYAISTTLKIITDELKLPTIETIVYNELYLLYKYLIKLRTTKEKRLIINIIVLR